MNQFMIPANTKKSALIFGLFQPIDLIIACVGLGLTMIFVPVFQAETITGMLICLTPLLIAGFLVFPIPNYHNTRILLRSLFQFLTLRQKYVWKGWCVKDE